MIAKIPMPDRYPNLSDYPPPCQAVSRPKKQVILSEDDIEQALSDFVRERYGAPDDTVFEIDISIEARGPWNRKGQRECRLETTVAWEE